MARAGVQLRPTRDGWAAGIYLAALLSVAWISQNNLVYLVASPLIVMVVLDLWLGWRNLAGVSARRSLPAEVYARRPVRWAHVVAGSDGRARFDLEVGGVPGVAPVARCAVVPPGEATSVSTVGVFPRRGAAALPTLRVQSRFPFGLAVRWVDLPVDDALTVFPEPRPGAVSVDGYASGGLALGVEPLDVRDMRPYRPGDRLRDVHWPTSARRGTPMVVVRDVARTGPCWVEVETADRVEREEAIGRAASAVLDLAAAGRAVGLRADGEVWAPRAGSAWRRQLLEVLATLPERGR